MTNEFYWKQLQRSTICYELLGNYDSQNELKTIDVMQCVNENVRYQRQNLQHRRTTVEFYKLT